MKIWTDLPAKHKRFAVIGVTLATLAAVVTLMPDANERKPRENQRPVTDLLGENRSSDARMDQLIAQIENMRRENGALTQQVQDLTDDLSSSRRTESEILIQTNRQVEELTDRLAQLETSGITYEPGETEGTVIIRTGRSPTSNGQRSGGPETGESSVRVVPEPVPSQSPGQSATSSSAINELGDPREQLWDRAPEQVAEAPQRENNRQSQEPVGSGEIRVIGGAREPTEAERAAAQPKRETFYIPAGSIITGTLISGMDAPTGQNARAEPFPATLRVKHEAILPNRYSADIRECFIIVGGYGDLSSERAYLRGETISCITNDGGVMESRIASFTVGEDGKAGLRGRLVTKQGQVMAKAAAADVLKNFSAAFSTISMPSFDRDSDTGALQQLINAQSMQSAGAGAAAGALDRIAEFYIEQANGMFPVIEIDAGREVEIIVSQGFSLTAR